MWRVLHSNNPKHSSTAPFEATLARGGFLLIYFLHATRVYLSRLWCLCLEVMEKRSIQVLPNAAALAETAAQTIVDAAKSAIDAGRRFSIALSGGSTPKSLYELLSNDPWYDRTDWSRWDVYFGDERSVPPTHQDSNYRMARQALLDHVANHRRPCVSHQDRVAPHQAADDYDQLLRQHFADTFPDVILLGMGDDGHTASLFPHTDALHENSRYALANFVPKLDTWRVTMSAEFINARQAGVNIGFRSE